jgi:thiaminase
MQDYAFLGGLLSAFGHALAFAPDLHSKQRLAFFMHHVCTAEVKFFHDSFQVCVDLASLS